MNVYGRKTPVEYFDLFFDNGVLTMIIDSSKKHAVDHNF